MTKPKRTSKSDEAISAVYDRCQTPAYALGPLLFHLRKHWGIWEPAAGEGNLVTALKSHGYSVVGSDLLTGDNFFDCQPYESDCIVTNPPYSIKYRWLDRCYTLGKPFALLVPLETLGAAAAQKRISEMGAEIIFMDKRVDFKMPGHTWQESSAQFPVIWLTWGLGIGREMTFAKLDKPGKQRRAELDAGVVQLTLEVTP